MTVDPQGENSKDLEINPLVAAGGNSAAARRLRVKSQLRDRFGRWIEMGRDSKIKARWQGKVVSIIGKFVGGSPDKPGYGMFVVKDDPNGIPSGVYHFKGKAVNQILARLDPEYLKSNNIDLNRDVNGNLIGDVLDKDIEDVENVRRDEIGSLDEALAGGQVKPEEDAVKVVARLKAPKHESENVVANLEEASKDDVAEGSDLVKSVLNLPDSDQEELPSPKNNFKDAVEEFLPNFAKNVYLEPSKEQRQLYAIKDALVEAHNREGDYPEGEVANLIDQLRSQVYSMVAEANPYRNEDEDLWQYLENYKPGIDKAYNRIPRRLRNQVPSLSPQSPDSDQEELPNEKKQQALSDEQKTEALAKVDKMAEIFTEAYPPYEWDDGTKLQKTIQDLRDAIQNGSSDELGIAARKLRDKTTGDNRNYPIREEARKLAINFIEDYGINPQRVEDEKVRAEVAIGNVKAGAEREKFLKYLAENGGPLEVAKKLLEQNPSNAEELKISINEIEAQGYVLEKQRDNVLDAYNELISDNPANATIKKILDATGVDLSQPSDNDTNAQARDSLLHMSDLIEKSNSSDKAELYDRLADGIIQHFDNKNKGVAGGRKKFAGKADTIQKITERKEGTTIDPSTLAQNRKGIAVALDGRNEETIDTLFFDDKLGDLLLADYIDKNMDKFGDTFKLGTWHDKDNNEVTLDVIEIFPEANRDEAIAAGQQRNQQGIFKLSNKEYIDTGGTGDRGRARRQREESRDQSGLGLGNRQGRVESPDSNRESGESLPSQTANSAGTPELRAIPARRLRKFDTGKDKYDSYELTGDVASDTVNMLDLGQEDMLSGINNPDSVENYRTIFNSIRENILSDDEDIKQSAIKDLQKVSLKVLDEAWGEVEPDSGYGMPESTNPTELAKSFYWYAKSVDKEANALELSEGLKAFLPDLKNITNRVRPSEDSRRVDSIVEGIEEAQNRKGGYPVEDVLSKLGELRTQLSRMVYEANHNFSDDFDDEEWADLKPIRDRVMTFLRGATKGWDSADYETTTVPRKPANPQVFTSTLVDELLPQIEANTELTPNGSEWFQNFKSAVQNGENVSEELESGIDKLKSDDAEGKNQKTVGAIQRFINSNKKFKKSHRPNLGPVQNTENSEEELPENPGSSENPNRESSDPADYVVDGTSQVEESLEDQHRKIGVQRSTALELNTRQINRSKMNERQKKILTKMITQRNKAIKALADSVDTQDYSGYERTYNYALATTNAIKHLIGGVESKGDNYSFGSGEEDRIKNFLVLEDSIKLSNTPDANGNYRVVAMQGFYTAKNGKTYIAEWSGTQATLKTINPDGKPGKIASYVSVSLDREDSRGPEFPASSTPSYLKTYGPHQQLGLGAASITFARLALEKSGKHFAHSGSLTPDGANNSKGIDPTDPERHHYSQAEKVLHLMDAPAIELLDRIGWFEDNYRMDMPGGIVNFRNFKRPIKAENDWNRNGSGDMKGPLYNLDTGTQRLAVDAWRKKRGGEDVVAGVDYPAFMKTHVESANGNYSSFGIRHLLTDMSYKDGISKEEGIKKLKQMLTDLDEYEPSIAPSADGSDETYKEYKRRVSAQLRTSINEIINGLEQWDEFDSKRVDRPKPFAKDSFKLITSKPYGEVAEDASNTFDFGLNLGTMLKSNIGSRYTWRTGATESEFTQALGYAPPENYAFDSTKIALRHTSEELKEAIKQGVADKLSGQIDESQKDFIVSLDHSRDYAEAPEFAPVKLSVALSALEKHGVDPDAFLAEAIDEFNGNDEKSEGLKESRKGRTSLFSEMDKVLKALGQQKSITAQDITSVAKVKKGSYDPKIMVVSTNRERQETNSDLSRELRNQYGYTGISPLIDNEEFFYPGGTTPVLSDPPSKENFLQRDMNQQALNFIGEYTTSNPLYIQANFDKDDLVSAFTDALKEQRNYVRLRFSSGQASPITLASIRDALQYQGVDTNAIARSVFNNFVDNRDLDVSLKPEGRIAPRRASEVVDHANTVIDLNKGFTQLKQFSDGINAPALFEGPDGKKYVVKRLLTSSDEKSARAVDQEIATQAFYRALGINASAPQRATLNGVDMIATEFIESDGNTYLAAIFSSDQSKMKAIANGLIGDLFLDQVDGPFNSGNVIIDPDGNPVRIDGGGGLLWDGIPNEGSKDQTERYNAGGFEGPSTPEQREALRAAWQEGSFEGNGIEFSLDYFLNPDGWHWNLNNAARKKILSHLTDEDLKVQAERYLLDNMTPTKINEISQIIRNPMDRAKVVDALIHRRKRILERFGVEDTYTPDEAFLSNRNPSADQLYEYYGMLDDLRFGANAINDEEYSELWDKADARDATAGTLSGLIEELRKRSAEAESVSFEEKAERLDKELEEAIKDSTEATAGFDLELGLINGTNTDNTNPYVPLKKSAQDLKFGDFVVTDNILGYVMFTSRKPDGSIYVAMRQGGGAVIDRVFDYDEQVTLDVGSRVQAGYESSFPSSDVRSTRVGQEFVNRIRSRSNAVLQDVLNNFNSAKQLPNGDLIVASKIFTEKSRLQRTFRFDVMVHRLPNEKFVSYVRRTQVDPTTNDPIGEPVIGRISKETHSSRHLTNRIKPLITNGSYRGIYGRNPNNWFNNSPDLQREVIHPGTKQPIPVSLAPENYLNDKYIGNTGIRETGDPIKDALISHIADLIDRGHEVSTVMNRMFQQTVLSKNQVADIADQIRANRQFPGVNQVPYVSRDNVNLVREGDRVRHYHPDGTIRQGVVIKRVPLSVNQRTQGEYNYTDVLRVSFDDGTRSPIVAKNLEILRRADGSTPEIGTEALRRNNVRPMMKEPVGLPDKFSVIDNENNRRIKHSTDPISHSQGQVMTIKNADGVESYIGAVWNRGSNPAKSRFADSITVTDPNVAQAWVVAKMNEREESYLREDSPRSVAPQNAEQSSDELSENPLDKMKPLRFATSTDNGDPENVKTIVVAENVTGENPDSLPRAVIELVDIKNESGKKTGKKRKEIKLYLNKNDFDKGESGITIEVDPKNSDQENLEIATKRITDSLQYKFTGPHKVLGQDLDFGDFLGIMASKIGRKHFRMPTFQGDKIISAEREAEYEEIVKRMIPAGVKPNPSGKPKVFFTGGGPGAGKGSIAKPNPKSREDDPAGFARPSLPVTQEWVEDGTPKPLPEGVEATGVMVNPDDVKTQFKEVRSSLFRLFAKREDPSIRLKAGDEKWASEIHEESSLLSKILLNRVTDMRLDVVVDGTGNDDLDKMIGKVKKLKAKDYRTIGVYLNAPPADAVGGAIGRAFEIMRKVPRNVQLNTFINLAKMYFDNKFNKDGSVRDKPPYNITEGVFDEFVLYDRRERGTPPFVVGYSNVDVQDGKYIRNQKMIGGNLEANIVEAKIKSYIPGYSDKDVSAKTKEEIFEALEKAGVKKGREEERKKKAQVLLNREKAVEDRLKELEEKEDALEYNKIMNKLKINQIAASLGITPQQVVNNAGVAAMVRDGKSVGDIIDYLRDGTN
jgi:hypothetical protein